MGRRAPLQKRGMLVTLCVAQRFQTLLIMSEEGFNLIIKASENGFSFPDFSVSVPIPRKIRFETSRDYPHRHQEPCEPHIVFLKIAV